MLAALSQQNDVLRRQVRSERRGRGRRETAMDGRELSALSKQVNALQERLNSAEHEQSRLHSQDQEMGLHALVDVSQQLVELVRKYTDKGMYAQALQTALLSAEVGSSQNHKSVGPLAALADLDIQQRRDEEAIVLLNHSWCGGRRGGRRVERLEHAGMPAQSVVVARGALGSARLVALAAAADNDAKAKAAWGSAGRRQLAWLRLWHCIVEVEVCLVVSGVYSISGGLGGLRLRAVSLLVTRGAIVCYSHRGASRSGRVARGGQGLSAQLHELGAALRAAIPQTWLHPAYKMLHAHAKEMSDRAQVAEARVQQFRTDAAALHAMRHREQATFDEYRERLASQVSDEAKQRSVELDTYLIGAAD